jgi:hypothetical protein
MRVALPAACAAHTPDARPQERYPPAGKGAPAPATSGAAASFGGVSLLALLGAAVAALLIL